MIFLLYLSMFKFVERCTVQYFSVRLFKMLEEYYNESLFTGVDGGSDTEYFSVNRFNSTSGCGSSALMILSFNIRSFNSNIDHFLSIICTLEKQPDVIVLPETWITEYCKDFCNIDGYISYHTVGGNGKGCFGFL